jgi:hypothetical protein
VAPLLDFWRDYAARIAQRQTTLWLGLIYLAVVGPTWLVSRLAGRRFFVEPGDPAGYWRPRPAAPRTLTELRRMG